MVFLFEGLDLPVKDISFYQPAFKKVTLQKMNQRGALSPPQSEQNFPPTLYQLRFHFHTWWTF